MKKYCILAIGLLCFYSCSNYKQQSPGTPAVIAKDSISFFPVTSFLKGQLLVLDSIPITPLKTTTIKGKTDSGWVPKAELKQLLEPFLSPVIDETGLIPYFKETSFTDQTINLVTFTYDPIKTLPDSIALQHWDVYINPETGKVMKVYMVKTTRQNDQRFTQQLTWQTDKQARIVTLLNLPGGNMELIKEVLITWDFSAAR